MNDAPPLLSLRGVAKSFGAVKALRSADLEVRPGEVHALMGANGAGKSTLVKVITGVFPADRGEIILAGRPVVFRSPAEARRAGIVSVYQDPAIVPDLTVAQNMRLARVPLAAVKAAMRDLGDRTYPTLLDRAPSRLRHPPADRPRARAGVEPPNSDAGRDHRRAAGRPVRAGFLGRAQLATARLERDLHFPPPGRSGRPLRPRHRVARWRHGRSHCDQGGGGDHRQSDARARRRQSGGGADPPRGGAG